MRLNYVQHPSISTRVNSSTFTRKQHVCVSLLLARGSDTAMPGELYIGLYLAFLVFLNISNGRPGSKELSIRIY